MAIGKISAKLSDEVPNAEERIDDALIAVSALMTTIVTARRDVDVPPATGQATIMRVAKAQLSLIDASSNVLRAHSDLVKIGREKAGWDIHPDCPEKKASVALHLAAVG
jgi:hypothetical protein